MKSVLFVDDRPCSRIRPCPFNYSLFERDDILTILLRAEQDDLDNEYLAQTEELIKFRVDVDDTLQKEVNRFKRWCEQYALAPEYFICMSAPRFKYWHAFARELGLPALCEEVAHALRHKPTMKTWLREAGLQTTSFKEVDSLSDIKLFTKEKGFPIVVKPTDGWGTIDTYLISSYREMIEIGEILNKRDFMVEDYIEYKEYECCALISGNEILDIYPSSMPQSPLDASYEGINANISLGPESGRWIDHNRMSRIVHDIVDIYGLKKGYLHMELFADNRWDDVIVSEVALRYPGCQIATNHGLSHGFNMGNTTVDVYVENDVNIKYTSSRCVGDLLLPYQSGIIEYITPERELYDIEGVICAHVGVREGDLMPVVERSSFNSSGWVLVEGRSPSHVEDRMYDVLRVFEIRSDKSI